MIDMWNWNFAQRFADLIDKREIFATKKLHNDPYYQRVTEEIERATDVVKGRLTFAELDDYESAVSEKQGMILDEVYLQGMRDGLQLGKILEGEETLDALGWALARGESKGSQGGCKR